MNEKVISATKMNTKLNTKMSATVKINKYVYLGASILVLGLLIWFTILTVKVYTTDPYPDIPAIWGYEVQDFTYDSSVDEYSTSTIKEILQNYSDLETTINELSSNSQIINSVYLTTWCNKFDSFNGLRANITYKPDTSNNDQEFQVFIAFLDEANDAKFVQKFSTYFAPGWGTTRTAQMSYVNTDSPVSFDLAYPGKFYFYVRPIGNTAVKGTFSMKFYLY